MSFIVKLFCKVLYGSSANPMDRKWFHTVASSLFPLLIIRLMIFSYVQQLTIVVIISDNQPTQNLEAIITFYGFSAQLVQLCFRQEVCGCTSLLGVSYPHQLVSLFLQQRQEHKDASPIAWGHFKSLTVTLLLMSHWPKQST